MVVVPASVINFDSLPGNTVLTNQFPEATFSSNVGFQVRTFEYPVASSPNVIAVTDTNGNLYANQNLVVDFSQAVNNLSFSVVGDDANGTVALIDIFTTTGFAGQVNLVTDGLGDTPDVVNLTSFTNITRISINSVTDPAGIGYDDFRFDLAPVNSIQGTPGVDTLTGTANGDTINGLDGNDRLIGLAGDDTLDGGAGNDYVFAGAGNDNVFGGDGNDLLYGEAGNDTINAGDGNDNLNGGAGNDILRGGLGDDIYTIDAGDTLTENGGEGTDTVNADFTYTLLNNFENLTLTGNAAINGNGNELNNQIFGNNAINTLNGDAGDDWLLGKGGNDTLNGGIGNDRLDGGTGDDNLTGGAGNDSYEVDSTFDVITEALNEGTDTVFSSLNWTLIDNFENLTLIGTGNFNATGNSVSNRLTGNSGNNTLTGNGGDDYLSGNAGNDILIGGAGNDILIGGAGLDIFNLAGNVNGSFDTLIDFKVGDDIVRLSATEFNIAPGALDSSLFVLGSAATNATQRFVYNQTNGVFSFDSDGNGGNAAVQIASFSNRVALTAASFTAV